MNMKKYLIPTSDFVIVRGRLRSMIYDLSRRRLLPVPHGFHNVISELRELPVETVRQKYSGTGNEAVFMSYLEHLKRYELVIESDHYIPLEPIQQSGDSSYDLDVLIVEAVNSELIKKINAILRQVSVMTFVLVLPKEIVNPALLIQELDDLRDSLLNSIELVLDSNVTLDHDVLRKIESHPKFRKITFYNAEIEEYSEDQGVVTVYRKGHYHQTAQKAPMLLNANIENYCESGDHNLFYNRKLFVGQNGEVRNMPDTPKLGELRSLLKDLKSGEIAQNSFWNARKDDTVICTDCEFRYSCVDSRIPLVNEATGKFEFDTECDYNPLEGTWS